ncbi:MAG: hypothetical protein DRG24_06295 [Epsilonproteobacteria bacterium]|nr:MAG: hypothetical protein DRG24_06295 [Campylobacterota bacterium]
MGFDTATNKIVQSEDSSFTAFSTNFNEHYHSTKDGALHESLQKHVIPALTLQADKAELTILDICYGLGFNTLATLYYLNAHNIHKKVRIFSPEMDGELVASLKAFPYPKEFITFQPIIESISQNGRYEDDNLLIEIYIGDARTYLRECKETFDIVYQDAFSPQANPLLWTREYFADIARLIKDDGVVTTYSIALKTRLALYENKFNIYLNEGDGYRKATLASKVTLIGFEKVNMEHKISCNPGVMPLYDS